MKNEPIMKMNLRHITKLYKIQGILSVSNFVTTMCKKLSTHTFSTYFAMSSTILHIIITLMQKFRIHSKLHNILILCTIIEIYSVKTVIFLWYANKLQSFWIEYNLILLQAIMKRLKKRVNNIYTKLPIKFSSET